MTELAGSSHLRPPSRELPAQCEFRILSIDGGGIRGVIPAILLARLEELLEAELREAGTVADPWKQRRIERPRVGDCFHLIAGTSTGGLLATGLAVPDENGNSKLPAAVLSEIYEKHGGAIFRLPLWRKLLNPRATFIPKYPLDPLARVLRDPALLGETLLKDASTEVLVTTYDIRRRRHRNFTRWGAADAGESKPSSPETISMVDVALATSAFPMYFPPAAGAGSELVDGGVFAANPTLAAIAMALRRTEAPTPTRPDQLLLVSLGTGSWNAPLGYGWGGAIGWLRPRDDSDALLGAILDGQSDHATEAAQMIVNGSPAEPWWDPTLPPDMLGGGPRFWRYQAPLPEPWEMDDIGRIPQMQAIGQEMARIYEEELRQLAKRLIADGPAS